MTVTDSDLIQTLRDAGENAIARKTALAEIAKRQAAYRAQCAEQERKSLAKTIAQAKQGSSR